MFTGNQAKTSIPFLTALGKTPLPCGRMALQSRAREQAIVGNFATTFFDLNPCSGKKTGAAADFR
jgi:hypothetical protein